MPFRYAQKSGDRYLLGLWRVEEPMDWFTARLRLFPAENEELSRVHAARALDFVSTRYLLHLLSGAEERIPCLKDTFGQPYLEDSTQRVSISHSKGLSAILLSSLPGGIDIQRWDSRMHRLGDRFACEDEMRNLDPDRPDEALHVIWGAKEAIFKAYYKGGLDFRTHIFCADFRYHPKGGKLEATVHKPSEDILHYSVSYRSFKEGMLVWALENSNSAYDK